MNAVYRKIVLAMMIIMLLLVGCSFFDSAGDVEGNPNEDNFIDNDNGLEEEDLLPIDDEGENVVKIYGNQSVFMEQYGTYIQEIYPELSFQFFYINSHGIDYTEQVKQFIEAEGIDVVVIDNFMYRKYIEDGGILYELDHLIMEDEFRLQDYSANVLNFLRNVDGGVYGLTPRFLASAIYYNKSLFDHYGVEYPSEQMTWEDLFHLAERLAAEDGIYGFERLGYLFGLVNELAFINGLDVVDENLQVTLDSQEWRDIWSYVMGLYDNGVIYYDHEGMGNSMFLQGQAAMAVSSAPFLHTLDQHKLNFEWDLALEPIHKDAPDESLTLTSWEIYSIPMAATNIEGAWKVIQYVNSSEAARKMLEADPHQFVSRQSVMEEYNKKYVEVFYSRKPSVNHSTMNGSLHSLEAFSLYNRLLFNEDRAIFTKERSLAEVLAEIRTVLEEYLRSN